MTDVHKALYTFWSSFGIPAYLTGYVPDEAELPYITFEVADGAAMSTTFLTAYVWVKEDNAQRAELLDKVKDAIPCDGTQLFLPSGMLVLYRNSASFMTYQDDAEDPTIIGGRISYQVNFYHL